MIPTVFSKTFVNSTTQQDSSVKLGSGPKDPRLSSIRARDLNPSSDEKVKNLKADYDIDCKAIDLSQVKAEEPFTDGEDNTQNIILRLISRGRLYQLF